MIREKSECLPEKKVYAPGEYSNIFSILNFHPAAKQKSEKYCEPTQKNEGISRVNVCSSAGLPDGGNQIKISLIARPMSVPAAQYNSILASDFRGFNFRAIAKNKLRNHLNLFFLSLPIEQTSI